MTIFVNGGLECFIRFMNRDERIGVLYPAWGKSAGPQWSGDQTYDISVTLLKINVNEKQNYKRVHTHMDPDTSIVLIVWILK